MTLMAGCIRDTKDMAVYSRMDIDESSSYMYNSCNESYFLETMSLNLNSACVPRCRVMRIA